ncbi:MAG: hypothetical protein GX167_08350 [Firmicutes bacterium]|nr:hypothetical protein [Bacillota bacterium]
MKRILAVLFTGMIIGASAMNLFCGHRLDELYLAREELRVKLYETTERLKKLEDQGRRQAPVISDIEIAFAVGEHEPLVELEIKADVLELTRDLIGTEVEKVQHQLVLHLLDKRLLKVGNKHYRLRLQTMVIAPHTLFVLQYAPEPARHEDEA